MDVEATPRSGPTDSGEQEPGLSRGTVLGVWALVAAFALVTLLRSAQVGVPLRDPGGKLVLGRFESAILLVAGFAVAQALWVAIRRRRSLRALPTVLRERWPWRRVWGVGMAILAYHLIYLCYRNLKSWVAFRDNHDHDLMALDRALFGGHAPAALLHDLLGQHLAAVVLGDAYDSFPKLVTLSVAGSLVLVRPVRRALLFQVSMMWVWVLGTATYYLVPSLGPFATYPQYFAGLTRTGVTQSQSTYLVQRAALLAHPGASDTYASISAFASLHVGVTCVILLMVHRYGHRRLSAVLGVYLAVIMVATVYVGMHFAVDVVAGVVIAVAAVWLGQLTVGRSVSPRRTPPHRAADRAGDERVGSPA